MAEENHSNEKRYKSGFLTFQKNSVHLIIHSIKNLHKTPFSLFLSPI